MTSSASKENEWLTLRPAQSNSNDQKKDHYGQLLAKVIDADLASPQGKLIDLVKVGRYRGREVRDILSNDRQLPDEIRKELTVDSRFSIDFETYPLVQFANGLFMYHRGTKYQLCFGNKLSTLRQSGYALLHFRYWPRLPIGFVYITQLTAEGFKVYREYDPKLAKERMR